jgi:4-aminobutyrate aminotransferase
LGHYTHEKNPVACAAGLATLACLEEEGLIENARRMGEYALARLKALAEKHEIIGRVRGLGLLLGVELVRDRNTRERAVEEAEQVMYDALSKGLSFKLMMGNVVQLTPPLTITKERMDEAINILDACLTGIQR